MKKTRRKAVKTIIATWAITVISMILGVASLLASNLSLFATSIAVFGISSIVCFIASIIGLVILYKNNEGKCATVWLATGIITMVVPVSPENLTALNLNMVVALANIGATIWAIIKLWEIGGSANTNA